MVSKFLVLHYSLFVIVNVASKFNLKLKLFKNQFGIAGADSADFKSSAPKTCQADSLWERFERIVWRLNLTETDFAVIASTVYMF